MSRLKLNNDTILAYLLDGNGGAKELAMNEMAAWTPLAGTLWVHLNYSNSADVEWLTNSSGLDPLIVEALIAEETRPRTTAIGDGLLIALRGVNLNPGADPEDMVSIRLYIDNTRIVTSRKRELISMIDLIEQFNLKRGPRDTTEFLVELVDRLVLRMSDTVDQFEDRVAELEGMLLAAETRSLRKELAALRRQAIAIRRYLAPEREALSRLISEKISWLDDGSRLQLREVSDRLIRHIEDIDAVRERAAVTQEELQSRVSEQMNTRMYVLSVVAAIFLPLGFLTGLLGINIEGIPGADYPQAFLVFIGMLIAVVALQMLLFRWKKWI
jgi:zinc transporter